MKNTWEKASIYVGLLSLTLAVSAISALGQVAPSTTGLVLTNSTTSNNPFLWLQDSSGNSGLFPILEVSGGQASQTLGIEVTSQTVSGTGTAPNLPAIMGTGFGGLSLVQTSAAISGTGRSSPVFSMCANQFGSAGAGGQGPACWSWQVLGGGSAMVPSDAPDTLQLFRTATTNNTANLTVLFPASINLATAANAAGTAGQITVGPAPYGGPNANVPSTFTGAGTSDTTSAATAGPVTVEPGQLLATTPNAAATEGALQILQSYKGSNGTGFANSGRLACPDPTAAQSVILCTSTGQAENWIGVYDSVAGQTGGRPRRLPASRFRFSSGRFDGGGRRFVPQKSVSTTWKSYAAVLTAANSEEDPMDAFAFALPIQIAYVTGSLTQVDITFTVTGGDGNGNPVIFAIDFIWDASLAVADNLASLKTAILNQCQSEFNLTVLSSNVNILMAVS